MKNKNIFFGVLCFSMIIGGGLVLAPTQIEHTALAQASAQEQKHDETADHDDHDDHDDRDQHDEKDGAAHNDRHEVHAEDAHAPHDDEPNGERHEEEGEGEHDDESNSVAMSKAQQKEIGLVVATARAGDIEQLISLVGEVRLHEDRMAHLVPRVPGIVHNVPVSLGDKVKEGQILALIDSHELAELKANYLEKSRNLDLTRRTFERKQYLKQENIASEADWLEAQSAFLNAETLLLSAKRRLRVLGLSENEISALPEAKDESFGRYALKSPLTGTIIAKHITRGEKIGEEEVFTVADLSVVWVDLQIPAKDLGRIKKGLRVEISSTGGKAAEGKLTLVGPLVDSESRTSLGRVELPNPAGVWRPGLFVTGQIQAETSASVVVVPSEAVQNINGEDVIFVPEEDGFKPVDVTPGKSVSGKTEILAGLHAGDRYVAKGAFALKAVIVTSGAGGHAGHGH